MHQVIKSIDREPFNHPVFPLLSTVWSRLTKNSEAWLSPLCLSASKSRESPESVVLQDHWGDFKKSWSPQPLTWASEAEKDREVALLSLHTQKSKDEAISILQGSMLIMHSLSPPQRDFFHSNYLFLNKMLSIINVTNSGFWPKKKKKKVMFTITNEKKRQTCSLRSWKWAVGWRRISSQGATICLSWMMHFFSICSPTCEDRLSNLYARRLGWLMHNLLYDSNEFVRWTIFAWPVALPAAMFCAWWRGHQELMIFA